jgi:hypothetical protein
MVSVPMGPPHRSTSTAVGMSGVIGDEQVRLEEQPGEAGLFKPVLNLRHLF